MMSDLKDIFEDNKEVIIFLAVLVIVAIPVALYIKSHATSEVYYTKGVVVDQRRWNEPITNMDSDGNTYITYSEHYETKVKLEDGAIFTDESHDAYKHTAVNETVDVKVTIWYWKGKYWDTTYSVR